MIKNIKFTIDENNYIFKVEHELNNENHFTIINVSIWHSFEEALARFEHRIKIYGKLDVESRKQLQEKINENEDILRVRIMEKLIS